MTDKMCCAQMGLGAWRRVTEDCASIPGNAGRKGEDQKHQCRQHRAIQSRQSVGLSAGPAVPPQACNLSESNCFPNLLASDFPRKSLVKVKGLLLGQGEAMSHQHATADTGC